MMLLDRLIILLFRLKIRYCSFCNGYNDVSGWRRRAPFTRRMALCVCRKIVAHSISSRSLLLPLLPQRVRFLLAQFHFEYRNVAIAALRSGSTLLKIMPFELLILPSEISSMMDNNMYQSALCSDVPAAALPATAIGTVKWRRSKTIRKSASCWRRRTVSYPIQPRDWLLVSSSSAASSISQILDCHSSSTNAASRISWIVSAA